MLYYLAVWSFLLGLVIGSFLNVVIYRLPRHESLVRPASHCPDCGTLIRGYDNVPVVSWLLLRGRCRSCRNPISGRYPLVESLTGVAFLAAFWLIGVSPSVFLAWVFIAVLVTLGFVDHDLSIMPNRIILPAVLVCLGASIALHPQVWWQYVAGCLGTGALALGHSLVRPGEVRFGAAKIALLVGAVFGLYAVVAFPIALLVGILLRISPVFWQKGRLRPGTTLVADLGGRSTKDHVEAVQGTEGKVDAEVMTCL